MSDRTPGDWRIAAEAVKDKPPCANCGKPYGNIYFGAAHFTTAMSKYAECPGYVPSRPEAASEVAS